MIERQGRRFLDLLHDKTCRYIGQRDARDETLIELIVACNIADHSLQKIVGLARGAIDADDLGEIAHRAGEFFQPFFLMLSGADGDEGGETEAELGRVEQSDTPLDHARLFKLLHPSPAGISRQMDALSELIDRE